MPDLLDETLNIPIIFRRRPIDIPGDMRPAWRISFLVLMLSQCCRGRKSSVRRLHVFNWCNRSAESGNLLQRAIRERIEPGKVLVRIEPSLARAVDLGVGAGLLTREGKDGVKLSPQGIELAGEIMADEKVFVREKEWAAALGQLVTEKFVEALFRHGRGRQ